MKQKTMPQIYVLIVAASEKNCSEMKPVEQALKDAGILQEKISFRFSSAHRTPGRLQDIVRDAERRGAKVIVAGAGGSAALPGVIASQTLLPVLGVPFSGPGGQEVAFANMAYMPSGYPVSVQCGSQAAYNQGLLAAQILVQGNIPERDEILKKLASIRARRAQALIEEDEVLQKYR